MLDGKTGQLQFHIEKKPVTFRSYDKYAGIIKSFPLIKADESIKVPIDGMDKKLARSLSISIQGAIKKALKMKSGVAIQNGFIYIFKKGI